MNPDNCRNTNPVWASFCRFYRLSLISVLLFGAPGNVHAECPLPVQLDHLKRLEGTEWETPTLKKILEKNKKKTDVDVSALEIGDIRDLYLDWEWVNFTKQNDPKHKGKPKALWLQKYESFKNSKQAGHCETCQQKADYNPLAGKESFTQLLGKSLYGGGQLRSAHSSTQPWLVARDFFGSLKSPAEVGLKESQRQWKERLLYNSRTGGFKNPPQYWEEFDNFFDPLIYNIRQCQSGSIQSNLGPVLFRDHLQEKDLDGIYFQVVPRHIRPAYLNKNGAIELGESTSTNADTAIYLTSKEYCEKHANSRMVGGRDLLEGKILLFFHNAIRQVDPELYKTPGLLLGSSPSRFTKCAEHEAAEKLGIQACLTPDESPDEKSSREVEAKYRDRSQDGKRGNSYFGIGMKDLSPPTTRKKRSESEDAPKEPGFYDPTQDNVPSVIGEEPKEVDSENLREVLGNTPDLEKKDWYQQVLSNYKEAFPKAKKIDQKLIAYLSTDIGTRVLLSRWSPDAIGDEEIKELVKALPDPETLVIEVDPAREWSPEKINECRGENSNCTQFVELMNDLYEDFSGPRAIQIESLTKEQKVKKVRELSRRFQRIGITLTDYQVITGEEMESIDSLLDRMEKDTTPEAQEELTWLTEDILKNIQELAPVRRENGSRYVVMGTGTLDDWESVLSDAGGSEDGATLQVAVTKWRSYQHLRVKLVGDAKRVALENTVRGTHHNLDSFLTFYKSHSSYPISPFHSDEQLKQSMTYLKNKLKEQGVVSAIDHFDQEIQRKKLGFEIHFLSEQDTVMNARLAQEINNAEKNYPGYTDIIKAFLSRGKIDIKVSQDKNASVKWNDELRRMEFTGLVFEGKHSEKAKTYRAPSAFGMCLILERQKVSESTYDNAQVVNVTGKATGSLVANAKKACEKLKKSPLQYFKIELGVSTKKSISEISLDPKYVSYPYSNRLFEDLRALRPDLSAKIDRLRAIHPGAHVFRTRPDDWLAGDHIEAYEAKLAKFLAELNQLESVKKQGKKGP